MFVPSAPYGWRGKGFQGDAFYSADNPPFGAVFTYYLKDGLQTKRKARQAQEKKAVKEGGAISYPPWDALRAEDREEPPAVVLTVTDEAGNVVRRITGPADAGFHRVAWDLRYPPADPASTEPFSYKDDDVFSSPPDRSDGVAGDLQGVGGRPGGRPPDAGWGAAGLPGGPARHRVHRRRPTMPRRCSSSRRPRVCSGRCSAPPRPPGSSGNS